MTDTITKRRCQRCGHEWYPRAEEPPVTCPAYDCRSPFWNRPRKKPLDKSRRRGKMARAGGRNG